MGFPVAVVESVSCVLVVDGRLSEMEIPRTGFCICFLLTTTMGLLEWHHSFHFLVDMETIVLGDNIHADIYPNREFVQYDSREDVQLIYFN